ncbi:MAG: PAS domain S-box protein [Sedimentisphaerales bacterium]
MENTRYKILMVEDDKLDQMAFERLVKDEKLPYDYKIAGSVAEAKKILSSERFDIVLSDYAIGDGTAFDVLELVKNTPIIFITGTGNEEVIVKAWRGGAYDYLTKDLDRNYLKAIHKTVETALKQKKAAEEIHRLSQAIEQSPSTIVITDIKGDIVYVNPRFTQMTGYTLEEVKGQNLRILESSEQPPELHKELWETITSGKEWRGEFHNQKKIDGTFWESASISAITNSEGAITGFLKVAEDITERKKIQELLKREQKNLEAVFDVAPIGMMLVDENMMVKRINNVIRKKAGGEHSQTTNQRYGNALNCIHSTDNEKGCGYSPNCTGCSLRKIIESVLESEQCVHEVEIQPTLKVDGKETKPWLCISAEPIMLDGCKHVIIAINDITGRKEAEEELRKAEEKYRTQFEGAMDAIFVADAETGILVDCNPAATRLVGREKSELIGESHLILHPTEAINGGEFSKTFKTHIKEKQGQVLEAQIVTKTGEIRDVAIKASLIEVRGRKLLQGIFRDITEHKEAERKLKEAIELKSQFISTVSHELRTPLASMKEGIAIILDGVAGAINDDQKNFLNIAQRNVDRLALLINDVLDFQKLEAGKMKMNIQENNINEVVEEVQKTMLPSAKKKGLDILLELDGNPPKAKFDRDKITQVLTNLVNNSIKFTEKGQVTVGVQQRDEELVIRVKDTGMGIPKDELTKIFDRFYRVQRPGKQIQGTGLGLPIVEKIVAMHGGRIEVESEVDKSTTFTIFLPLAAKSMPEFPSAEMDELLENNLVNNQTPTK